MPSIPESAQQQEARLPERGNIGANAIPQRQHASGNDAELSSSDRYLLERVDGYSSIEELALMVGLHVKDAMKAVERLQQAGVVTFSGQEAGPQTTPPAGIQDDQQEDGLELEGGSTDIRLKPGVADDTSGHSGVHQPWWSTASSAASGDSQPWEGSYSGELPLPKEGTTRATPGKAARGTESGLHRRLARARNLPEKGDKAHEGTTEPLGPRSSSDRAGAASEGTGSKPVPKATPPPPAPRAIGRSTGAKTPAVDQRARALGDTGELTSKTVSSGAPRQRGAEDDTDRIDTVANYGRDKEDTKPHPTPPESSFRATPARGSSPATLPSSGTTRFVPGDDESETATAQVSRPVAGRSESETRPQDPVHDDVTASHEATDVDETGPQPSPENPTAHGASRRDQRIGSPDSSNELPEADEVLASLDLSSRATEVVDVDEESGPYELPGKPWSEAPIDDEIAQHNDELNDDELRMLSWYVERVNTGTYYSLLNLEPDADDSTVAAAISDARRFLERLRGTGRCSSRGAADIDKVLAGVEKAEKVLCEREARRRYDNALRALSEMGG